MGHVDTYLGVIQREEGAAWVEGSSKYVRKISSSLSAGPNDQ